jgi:hypothetical protein
LHLRILPVRLRTACPRRFQPVGPRACGMVTKWLPHLPLGGGSTTTTAWLGRPLPMPTAQPQLDGSFMDYLRPIAIGNRPPRLSRMLQACPRSSCARDAKCPNAGTASRLIQADPIAPAPHARRFDCCRTMLATHVGYSHTTVSSRCRKYFIIAPPPAAGRHQTLGCRGLLPSLPVASDERTRPRLLRRVPLKSFLCTDSARLYWPLSSPTEYSQ